MKITFKLTDEKNIEIMNGDKVIGRIFTPSGTTHDEMNAIQVCGFDDIFDYWGCGIFGDGKGNAKRDVQLWFDENSQKDGVSQVIVGDSCPRCYYLKENCQCDKFKLDLRKIDVIKEKVLGELEEVKKES